MAAVKDIDHGWKAIRAEMAKMPGSYTKIGVQSGEKREDQTDMVTVAMVNEFGSKDGKIPARSFIRSAHDENRSAIRNALKNEAKKITSGASTVKVSLGRVGLWMEGQIKKKILSNVPPPNAPATVAKKTRAGKVGNKTLVDTGQMLNSIRHVEVINSVKA